MKNLYEIISQLDTSQKIEKFLNELLTESETDVLLKRWSIIKMLNEGYTQRDIAKELNVSLCKVTRGSKILKDKNAIITKLLKEDKTNNSELRKFAG